MDFMDLAARRYSCRSFSDQKVPQELMDQIVEAGLLAPTALNKQPFHIFSLDSEQVKEDLKQVTSCTFGADRFLLVGCRRDAAWERPFDGRNFGDVDASIVATHIMLAAFELGLATTWVGYFDAPLLQKLYPQTADYELIALFPIGYPAQDALPGPNHGQRKGRQELLTSL